MAFKARLDRIEAQLTRRELARAAAEHGLTVTEILEEIRAFEAMPLAEQLANIDEHAAELTADGVDVAQFKAQLRRAAGVTPRPPAPAKRSRGSRPAP